jgi:hypothetical protein
LVFTIAGSSNAHLVSLSEKTWKKAGMIRSASVRNVFICWKKEDLRNLGFTQMDVDMDNDTTNEEHRRLFESLIQDPLYCSVEAQQLIAFYRNAIISSVPERAKYGSVRDLHRWDAGFNQVFGKASPVSLSSERKEMLLQLRLALKHRILHGIKKFQLL